MISILIYTTSIYTLLSSYSVQFTRHSLISKLILCALYKEQKGLNVPISFSVFCILHYEMLFDMPIDNEKISILSKP